MFSFSKDPMRLLLVSGNNFRFKNSIMWHKSANKSNKSNLAVKTIFQYINVKRVTWRILKWYSYEVKPLFTFKFSSFVHWAFNFRSRKHCKICNYMKLSYFGKCTLHIHINIPVYKWTDTYGNFNYFLNNTEKSSTLTRCF
jgi:hypothetical protein